MKDGQINPIYYQRYDDSRIKEIVAKASIEELQTIKKALDQIKGAKFSNPKSTKISVVASPELNQALPYFYENFIFFGLEKHRPPYSAGEFYSQGMFFLPLEDDYDGLMKLRKLIIEKQTGIPEIEKGKIPKDWGWINKSAGHYSFGTNGEFKIRKGKRRNIFIQFMELFEMAPAKINVQKLANMTNTKPDRLRIDLNAISKRLVTATNLCFESDRKGFYSIHGIQ